MLSSVMILNYYANLLHDSETSKIQKDINEALFKMLAISNWAAIGIINAQFLYRILFGYVIKVIHPLHNHQLGIFKLTKNTTRPTSITLKTS
jgi:hypothetical protein